MVALVRAMFYTKKQKKRIKLWMKSWLRRWNQHGLTLYFAVLADGDASQSARSHWLLQVSAQNSIILQDFKIRNRGDSDPIPAIVGKGVSDPKSAEISSSVRQA